MKIYSFLIAIVALSLVTSCNNDAEMAEKAKLQQDSLLQVQQDSLLDLFRGELQAIATKVSEVNASQGIFSADTGEGTVLSKDVIIGQLEALNQMLNSNQKQLSDVYKRMKDSKVKNEDLENMIKSMQSKMAEREGQIAELMKMLADKDIKIEEIVARVDSMRVTNINLAEKVIDMDESMHQVYYVVGEAKELKEKGIISKEGGLLGLGSTKKLDVSKLDVSLFKLVDQRELQSIPLYSKKAKLITNHPEGSYTLKTDSEGKVESLDITDRKRFWTATDYLVVEVSN
jgi:hypothetical protein